MTKEKKSQQFEGLRQGAEFSPFDALEQVINNNQVEQPKEEQKAPKTKINEPKANEPMQAVNVMMPQQEATILKLVAMYEGKKIKILVREALQEYYKNPKHKKYYDEALKNANDFLK